MLSNMALRSAQTIGLCVAVLTTPLGVLEAIGQDSAGQTASAELADPDQPIELIDERYPSGNVKIRREMTLDSEGNYINHGSWTMYSENGDVIATGEYQHNRRHGNWTRVHSKGEAPLFEKVPFVAFEGPFTSEATFENGQLQGKWIILDAQQRKIIDWNYVDGVRHGASVWKYPSGDLYQEVFYDNGVFDGQHRRYDSKSQLIVDDTYQLGRKLALQKEVDKEENTASEFMYLHPQLVIDKPVDWWNATPATYKTSGKGLRHGRSATWHPNGRKKSEGIYEFDARDGQFKWWFENSQQMVTANYKDGQPHGTWTWWHSNGVKSAQGQFTDGVPSGTWSYWTDLGRLLQKADYDGDEMIADKPQELQLELRTSDSSLPRTVK